MSQVAIICLFDADRSAGEELAIRCQEELQDAGLPVIRTHVWNDQSANLAAMGSLLSTAVQNPLAPVPPPPDQTLQ